MTAQASERTDRVFTSGLAFRPGDPVRIRVVHRERRTSVSDDGAAVDRAGRPQGWQHAARRVADGFVVNVSRTGVVSLPVVRVGPPEDEIIHRISEASLALYQELLDRPINGKAASRAGTKRVEHADGALGPRVPPDS